MAKQSKKSIEQQIEELNKKKIELEKLKKSEEEKFYSIIGYAIIKEQRDHNALFDIVKKYITKKNEIDLVKQKLNIENALQALTPETSNTSETDLTIVEKLQPDTSQKSEDGKQSSGDLSSDIIQ